MDREIKRRIVLRNEEETRDFGLALAQELKDGGTLALVGDLGTGKTTITKYIAEGLGIKNRITSPTFTIVNEYREDRTLYHMDAYRLEEAQGAENLGLDEYFYDRGAISIVEWGDNIEGLLPEDCKYIYMSYGAKENERIAECTF